ncbi:DNA (cytosine-5)-methyltransferase 3B [Atta colombica]|uniref:DNA (cytosine-5-)-methyltransferase n=1 Tax=Atta colombica TaxID=520822 RepID=A0A195BF90_9HYME|nr:DNA (cytosine-5)-methyltransferase 3B [Atta colombica]
MCGPHGGVCVAVRGTRGTLYEWNVSTPSVAREAPVCPACKHNNTDVSIHQVDPGGVERPREMPLEAPRELCEPKQKPDQLKKKSSNLSMIANVWALSCALDLGLLRESSLKEVVIASCSELDFPSTTEDAGKSSDFEKNDHEDDATKSANIFGNSWPFIDPTQIKQITSTKPAQRKRRRKVRLSLKRYKKPRTVYSKINDAIVNLAIENETSLPLQGSERENLNVSHDRSARLSARKNSSSTRSRALRNEDERLSESSESSEDEEEVISQTSSEIAPVDYSGSGYSKFYSQSHAKEDSQNREELSEYPDYFMNVLRIDDSIENNDLDTSEDVKSIADTSKDDDEPLLVKFAKFSERRATRKSLENENVSRKTRGMLLRKKKSELENGRDHSVMSKRKRNKSMEQKRNTRNSAAHNNHNRRRISHNSEENSSKSKSDLRDDVTTNTRDIAEEIVQKCCNCKTRRRRSRNFTNTTCPCKRNPKDTAAAIMRDIQECISTKIEETISKNGRDMLEKSNHKDSNQDVSMEYEWVDKNEFKNQDLSSQKFEQSTNVEESLINVNPVGRRRKKRYRYSIDCKQDENTETAYRSVFHDCVDFDTPGSAPSLKINMEEIWKSEDSSDNDDRIHSSWRRSTLESSTEECGNEVVDSAMLLAMKIVSDDSIKDEKCDDKDETLNNACLKYHEKSDTFLTKINSFDDSNEAMEDIKFMGQRDEAIITYTNKNRTIRRSASDGNFAKDEDDDSKDQDTAKNMKISSKVNVMRQCSRNKGNNLKHDNDKKSESGPRRVTRALVKTKNINENHPGKLVWGFFSGWWPALIVDAEHVGMAPEPDKLWVFWIGESQISLLKPETQIQPFSRNLEERLSQPSRKNIRSRAIDATIQILRQRFNCTLTKPYYYWIRRNIANLETLDDLTFHPYPENIQEKLDGLKEKNSKATKKFMSRRKSSPEPPPKKQNTEKNKNVNTSWEQIDDERLCLQSQQPGVIAWAKIPGHCWWPAMIIDYRDCCLKEPSFGCQWIMWYGDYQVSEVRHLEFLKFHKGIEKMREYIQNTNRLPYLEGVLQASKDYCSRLGCDTDNWTLDNVFEYFSNNIHIPSNQLQVSDSNRIYDKYSKEMVKKINEFKFKSDIGAERKRDIKASNDFRRIVSGDCDLENLCLKCLKVPKGKKEEHPFFVGSLCKECSDEFKPCMFVHGNDGKCFYCTICANTGTVLICDSEDCPRVYCTACLKFLICPKSFDDMLLEDPWECFLCRDKTKQPKDLILRPRLNWKEHFTKMFRTTPNFTNDVDIANLKKQNKAVRVLSLFDGLSTGFLVLQKLGLVVEVYYASEIDVNALTISSAHFGDRITYLGDVRGITKEKIQEIAPIDLLIGGSPCNDLSLVNPARLGLHDPKGTGILFFEYCRIKKLVEKANKGRHMFWLFENVASMPTEYRLEINKNLGREPDVIDSADFSPQHRLRLYWHNLPFNPYMPLFESRQDVQDKLTPNLNRKALCKKLHTVTGRTGSLLQGKAELKPIIMKGKTDTIWITELEEIFGFPRHYTDVKNLSATNRQKILGKSWSVQTLIAILRPLCLYFKCNEDETSKKSVF